MKKIGKYSMGLGDRFGHQGEAQLKAIIAASVQGIEITPVWNKSDREHTIIGTHPRDVRVQADTVTKKIGFKHPYFVDADHINHDSVDRFIESSDFFTIDVASFVGKRPDDQEIADFLASVEKYTGVLKIPGTKLTFKTSKSQIKQIAENYLFAVLKAWDIFRKIEKAKGRDNFIVEVSMDEVPDPQTPVELFFILKMLASEDVPLQTIALRFSGRFNKGVDYVGDPLRFAAEFEADLQVIDYAIKEFGLPENLKMSIHSGSDKFSIYPHLGSILRKHDKGIHLKTAGTTWLEEVIGLASSGGEALVFVKQIYSEALTEIDALSAPYSNVIEINVSSLPSEKEVSKWDSTKFAHSLRHVPGNHDYNPNMRQLIHVAYKLAAQRKEELHRLLELHEKTISECVYENIYERHICRLFDIR
jgi:hypothetical protein